MKAEKTMGYERDKRNSKCGVVSTTMFRSQKKVALPFVSHHLRGL
jgi:hypothetical protein